MRIGQRIRSAIPVTVNRLSAFVFAVVLAAALHASDTGARLADAGPATHPRVANRVTDLRAMILSGERERAERQARALLEDVRSEFGPNSLEYAEALDVLVEALWRGPQVDEDETRALAEEAVSIKETLLGDQDERLANSLTNLGIVLDETGSPDLARVQLERARLISETALGPNHPQVAGILRELGFVLEGMGEYQQALHSHERALRILDAAENPNELELAAVLNGLAGVQYQLGLYTKARDNWERVAAIRERNFGHDHVMVARILNNLGAMLNMTGDLEAADDYLERALAIYETHKEDRFLVRTLNNLGNTKLKKGDLSAAEPLLKRVCAIVERDRGPDHPTLKNSLRLLARLNATRGDWEQALAYGERALGIVESNFGGSHPIVGDVLWEIGKIESQKGDFDSARSKLTRALDIRSAALGASHPLVAETLSDLALVLAYTDEPSAALDAAVRAEGMARRHLQLTVHGWSEREALLFARVRTSGLDVALQLVANGSVREPAALRRVWDELIRSRAFVLDEMTTRSWLASQSDDPDLATLKENLLAARRRLANLSLRDRGDASPERYRKLFEQALHEAEIAERELAAKSLLLREGLHTERVGFAEIASHLAPGDALVAFAMCRRFDRAHPPNLSSLAAPVPAVGRAAGHDSTFVALVVAHGRDPIVVSLESARTVDSLVAGWREEAAFGPLVGGRTEAAAEAAYERWGTALRRSVWDPLESHLEGAEHIFVVPERALSLVNFAALPADPKGYILDTGRWIHYLASERDFVRFTARPSDGRGLLALGGPSFNEIQAIDSHASGTPSPSWSAPSYRGGVVPCADLEEVRFEPLPAAALEARDIAELWQRVSDAGQYARRHAGVGVAPELAAPRAELLIGSTATEAAFKSSAPGKQILHIATHGFFVDGPCELRRSNLRGIGGLSLEAPTTARTPSTTNALLQAGLVFAGANHRHLASPDGEDGVLTAEEIAAMDLHGVQWAVLSACDTGVGRIQKGEGVLGLRWAFQVAGARSLIMSLWMVDDAAAPAWMEALYTAHFEQGMGTAEAVYHASLQTLQARRQNELSTHPFYWASFVAAGDWR